MATTTPNRFDYSHLYEFCTVRQLEILQACEAHGHRGAASKLKCDERYVTRTVAMLKKRAALRGHSPAHDMTKTVPDGYMVKGVSTYYDNEGKVKGQWVKSAIDADKVGEILREFANTLGESVKGMSPAIPSPPVVSADTLTVIPLGDPHYGMKAWHQDAGGDFDLNAAESLTAQAIDRLVNSGPASEIALLLNLGDMFHADNQQNMSKSGHQLDVDGRWAKVQQVGLRSMLYCINRLLEKHQTVIVRINRGNHDGHSSYALSMMLACFYSNETRVQIDLSPAAAWYYSFGRVLIGSTHGDTIRGKDMIGIMAADQPEEWGRTKHRYWYVGHVHHKDVKEYPGGIVEYFRTLAAGDAWHTGQGYRSGRDVNLIVMHKDHGEIERHRVDVGMLTIN